MQGTWILHLAIIVSRLKITYRVFKKQFSGGASLSRQIFILTHLPEVRERHKTWINVVLVAHWNMLCGFQLVHGKKVMHIITTSCGIIEASAKAVVIIDCEVKWYKFSPTVVFFNAQIRSDLCASLLCPPRHMFVASFARRIYYIHRLINKELAGIYGFELRQRLV